MNQLQVFYQNQSQREIVKAFMIEVLKEMAVERTFEGKDIGGIKDAKDCIDKAFNQLEEKYGKIQTVDIPNSR